MSTARLPDLNELPSVLETHQVNTVLEKTVTAARENPGIQPQDAIDLIVDALLARGYRPGDPLDTHVSKKVLDWIKIHWNSASLEFLDAATTALTNLNNDEIDPFLDCLIQSETRGVVLQMIRECQAERE